MSTEDIIQSRLEQAQHPGWHYVPRTQVPLAFDALTDVTSRLSRVEQRVEDHSDWMKRSEERFFGAMRSLEHRIDVAVQTMEARIDSSAKAMEIRFEGAIKRVEGSITKLEGSVKDLEGSVKDLEGYVRRVDAKVDSLSVEFENFKKPFEEMKSDVKDLIYWKHKVWGMVLLAGIIGTASTIIVTNVTSKSSPAAEPAVLVLPPQIKEP